MIGQTVGHYQILEMIGSGGMGEVYLADDTTLGRKVALKFLPRHLQQDTESTKRFIREARSAAALDHPFICNIHQIGEVEDSTFIAMEYVEGQTLKDRLADGPLDMVDATRIAAEISQALEKAHEKGIIHRDLKPSNIMLTPQGHVKVMDFGLAKQLTQGLEGVDSEATLTASLTQEGVLVGTLGYMSPEQVRGEKLDYRSDIFSLGVIYYEMLTGENPFRRENPMDTLSAVLGESPPSIADYVTVPPDMLVRIVDQMMAKQVDERFPSSTDMTAALTTLQSELALLPGLKSRIRAKRIRKAAILAGATAAAAVVAILVVNSFRALIEDPPEKAEGIVFMPSDESEANPAWRPVSGDLIAYEMDHDIWARDLSMGPPRNYTADLPGVKTHPTWSPDGQQIVFRCSGAQSGAALYTMSWQGENKRRIHDLGGNASGASFCLSWTVDSLVVFSDFGAPSSDAALDIPLKSLNLRTNDITQFPHISPDGTRVTLGTLSPKGRYIACRIGANSYSDYTLYLFDRQKEVFIDSGIRGRNMIWDSSGEYLYYQSAITGGDGVSIWRARIHQRSGRLMRAEQVSTNAPMGRFSLNPLGDQIITDRGASLNVHFWLTDADNPPTPEGLTGEQITSGAVYRYLVRWIPNTSDIVFHARRFGNWDIFRISTEPGQRQPVQLTDDEVNEAWAVVSPDGELIIYNWLPTDEIKRNNLMNISGGAKRALDYPAGLLPPETHIAVHDWAKSGWKLAGYQSHNDREQYLAVMTLDPESKEIVTIDTLHVPGQSVKYPFWSPDEKYLAYQVDGDIYTVNVETGERKRVSHESYTNFWILGWTEEPSYIYMAWMMEWIYRVQMDDSGNPIGDREIWARVPEEYGVAPFAAFRGNQIVLGIVPPAVEGDMYIYDISEWN